MNAIVTNVDESELEVVAPKRKDVSCVSRNFMNAIEIGGSPGFIRSDLKEGQTTYAALKSFCRGEAVKGNYGMRSVEVNKLIPLLDAEGNEVFEPIVDAEGNQVYEKGAEDEMVPSMKKVYEPTRAPGWAIYKIPADQHKFGAPRPRKAKVIPVPVSAADVTVIPA